MRTPVPILFVLLCFCLVPDRLSAQIPGYSISNHTTVFGKVSTIDFGVTGVAYCGNSEEIPPEQQIFCIEPGGAPIQLFGDAINDPDAVFVDRTGAFSGEAGSVIVAGQDSIYAVAPETGFATLLHGGFDNVGAFTRGANNKLYFANGRTTSFPDEVYVWEPGMAPSLHFCISGVIRGVGVQSDGTVFVGLHTGEIYRLDPMAAMPTLVTTIVGGTSLWIIAGPGGSWGEDLYWVNGNTGELITIDNAGAQTVLGTAYAIDGLSSFLRFGPDGALYIQRQVEPSDIDRVVPLADSEFVRGDADGDGSVDLFDAIKSLQYLFLGHVVPCEDSLDFNDSGAVTISDTFEFLCWQFCQGPGNQPMAPYPSCGADPVGDTVGCVNVSACP